VVAGAPGRFEIGLGAGEFGAGGFEGGCGLGPGVGAGAPGAGLPRFGAGKGVLGIGVLGIGVLGIGVLGIGVLGIGDGAVGSGAFGKGGGVPDRGGGMLGALGTGGIGATGIGGGVPSDGPGMLGCGTIPGTADPSRGASCGIGVRPGPAARPASGVPEPVGSAGTGPPVGGVVPVEDPGSGGTTRLSRPGCQPVAEGVVPSAAGVIGWSGERWSCRGRSYPVCSTCG
jgi:hypothetical protein